MYALVGIAFFFYVTKVPERLVPGLVDIGMSMICFCNKMYHIQSYFSVGHSHQWWHVIIFVALWFWHKTGMTFAMFRLKHGCLDVISEEQRSELIMWPFY